MHDRIGKLVYHCIDRSVNDLMREYIKGTLQPWIVAKETNINHYVQRKVLMEIRTECAINNLSDDDCKQALANANKFFTMLEYKGKRLSFLPTQSSLTRSNGVLGFT